MTYHFGASTTKGSWNAMAVEPLTKNDTDPYVGGLFRMGGSKAWQVNFITHWGLSGRTRYIKIGYTDTRRPRKKSLCPQTSHLTTIYPEECTWEVRLDGTMLINDGRTTYEFSPRVPTDEQLEFMMCFTTQ